MVDVNVKNMDGVWRSSKVRGKSDGMLLEKNGIDDILRFLSKKGYRSYEALELQKEMEQLKQKYDELIKHQSNMPGKDKVAEAVIKYYLFQLEELKLEFPYDAMGCEFTVPLLVLQEFQKEAIAERIMNYLGKPDNLSKEELQWEIQRFTTVHLDPKGISLYMTLQKMDTRA